MTIQILLPEYLHQWLVHEYGDQDGVVRLPLGCAEHDVMECTLKPWPEDVGRGQVPWPWNTLIHVPEFKARSRDRCEYMSEHAKKMLAHVIYVRFRAALWQDIYKLDRLNASITDSIYDWMEGHGIELTEKNWETIRQMYFRQRKSYRKRRDKK